MPNAVTFTREFQSARLEAEKAFGDGPCMEKYLENPRHIEFQSWLIDMEMLYILEKEIVRFKEGTKK